MTHKAFLWPDHAIGKRESRTIREEHNELYNAYHDAIKALRDISFAALARENACCPCNLIAAKDQLLIARQAADAVLAKHDGLLNNIDTGNVAFKQAVSGFFKKD